MEAIPGRVMVFGTFDVFHPGHQYFIQKAQDKGEELIVVVARDENVLRFKDRLRNGEKKRKEILEKAFPSVKVVLGSLHSPLENVRKYRPELICLGYDQIGFLQLLKEELPDVKTKRIKAFHPDKYKSSKMP